MGVSRFRKWLAKIGEQPDAHERENVLRIGRSTLRRMIRNVLWCKKNNRTRAQPLAAVLVLVIEKAAPMKEVIFDHDRPGVYRWAVEYTAKFFGAAKGLSGLHRHARDPWLRAAQSIPLNIAEGNGKRSSKDRARFFDVARGSAFECAAIQEVLAATGGLDPGRVCS